MRKESNIMVTSLAIALFIISFLIRFTPYYIGIRFPYDETIFSMLSYGLLLISLPVIIYQLNIPDRKISYFISSTCIFFLLGFLIHFELVPLFNWTFMVILLKIIVILLMFLGISALMMGIGLTMNLRKNREELW